MEGACNQGFEGRRALHTTRGTRKHEVCFGSAAGTSSTSLATENRSGKNKKTSKKKQLEQPIKKAKVECRGRPVGVSPQKGEGGGKINWSSKVEKNLKRRSEHAQKKTTGQKLKVPSTGRKESEKVCVGGKGRNLGERSAGLLEDVYQSSSEDSSIGPVRPRGEGGVLKRKRARNFRRHQSFPLLRKFLELQSP